MNLVNIIGVQFRRAGKIYDFDAGEYAVRIGDSVVVETDRGPSLATVATLKFGPREKYQDGLKGIVRLANDRDLDTGGRLSPEKSLEIARERVQRVGLDMRVLKVEHQFGGSKCVVYFSAPGRVDFRDLVKELATGLKSRVELKQVGARDEAKLIGGMGICGREFCCSSFLREFVPVSIKMAKNQNLALNPTKISGGCGRLLCCLTYEDETYKQLSRTMPPRGARAKIIETGQFGDVLKSDFLNQSVLLELEDGTQISVKVPKIEIVDRAAGQSQQGPQGEEWGEDIDLDSLEKN